jgi:hypothetical protein
MKIQAFWDVTPCRLVNNYQSFGEVCYLALDHSEDGGSKLLRKVSKYFPIHTVSYCRSLEYSTSQDAILESMCLSLKDENASKLEKVLEKI